MLFSASVFFAGNIKSVNAQTYDQCMNDYNGTAADCAGYPGDPNIVGPPAPNPATSFSSEDTMDSFQTTNPTDSGGNSSNCDPSPSCWFYNCCSDQDSSAVAAPTPEQKAAAEKAALEANTSVAAQNGAVRQYDTANANVSAACVNSTSPACVAARKAANDAAEALVAANAEAEKKIAEAQASNAAYYGNSEASVGSSSYFLCGNGIMAMSCEGNVGTPVVSVGMNIGGTGLGNVAGVNGSTPPKCGVNFKEVGGVCFPVNTGLSDAPIYVILSNLFSWLMGLFTTFAVIAFVISGIQYLTSAGDDGQMETAKRNATYAIIGIVVGLSGFIIIKAIAAALSGQSYFF